MIPLVDLLISRFVFSFWTVSPANYFVSVLLGLLAGFVITILFSQCRTTRDFVNRFRLRRRPDLKSWLGVLGGLLVSLAVVYGGKIGLVPKQLTPDYIHFSPRRHEYLLYMMLLGQLSPILEEPLMRGFLYPVFRRSYGAVLATALLVVINSVYHLFVFTAWYLFVMTAILTVMLCLLREKTDNLWGCILAHWVYNTAQHPEIRLVGIIIVFLLLPYMGGILDVPNDR
ncbi:MAG: type II CAAX endopeptidase family protein [Verrucomicrobiia bacterium]